MSRPLRGAFVLALVIAQACAAAPAPARVPTAAPTDDPTLGVIAPAGPILFEPEELVFPPERFPLPGYEVAYDAPVVGHGWERQFVGPATADHRWFTVRLFVFDPDVVAGEWVARNGCDVFTWPGERPRTNEIDATEAGDAARACRFDFGGGARVFAYTTGVRNLGITLESQPRDAAVTDRLALDWLVALARRQIAIVYGVLAAAPPPRPTFASVAEAVPDPAPPVEAPTRTSPLEAPAFAFEPPRVLPRAVGGRPYAYSFCAPQVVGACRGGRGPIQFQVAPGGGFFPIGLGLSADGTIDGTPMVTTDVRVYQFTVCAADGSSKQICKEVWLPVDVQAPAPTATTSARATLAPATPTATVPPTRP